MTAIPAFPSFGQCLRSCAQAGLELGAALPQPTALSSSTCPAQGGSFPHSSSPSAGSSSPGRLRAAPGRQQSPCPSTAPWAAGPCSAGQPWAPLAAAPVLSPAAEPGNRGCLVLGLGCCSTETQPCPRATSPRLQQPRECSAKPQKAGGWASFRRCLQELQLLFPQPDNDCFKRCEDFCCGEPSVSSALCSQPRLSLSPVCLCAVPGLAAGSAPALLGCAQELLLARAVSLQRCRLPGAACVPGARPSPAAQTQHKDWNDPLGPRC